VTRVVWVSLLIGGITTQLWAGEIGIIVIDPKGNPVEDAVVVAKATSNTTTGIEAGTPELAPRGSPTATVTQIRMRFEPYVTAVPVGARINFPNKDNVLHNVYSFSKAKTFELPLYRDKLSDPVVFDKPGVVILGCNIHDWMVAYVYVADTPFFAMTDSTGHATLRGLSDGEYDVEVWHPRKRKRGSSPKMRMRPDTDTTVRTEFVVGLKPDWRPQAPR
jgi:plastocyanin